MIKGSEQMLEPIMVPEFQPFIGQYSSVFQDWLYLNYFETMAMIIMMPVDSLVHWLFL